MGNFQAYKKIFVRTKCSYCGDKQLCTEVVCVEDAANKMKFCKKCYNTVYARNGWRHIDKLETR